MSSRRAYLVLALALLLVSTSAPFLVLAHMDAFTVVLLRLGLSAPLFLLWAAGARLMPASISRRHLGELVLGGALMAAHFLLWVKAFDLTDYASNLLLLVAQPVIAAVLGLRVGERLGSRAVASILFAVAGLLVIAGGDFTLGRRALAGDAMCVLADLAIALFYVVARDARARMPLPLFLGLTYGIGALFSIPVVLAAGSRLRGTPVESWLWLVALVLLTTMAGHGLMNLAARHVPLFTLNIVIVLEPAIGILLGALLFGATLRPLQLGGGLLLAVAVWLGVSAPRARAPGS